MEIKYILVLVEYVTCYSEAIPLVLVDYVTCYLEAIPLRAIDAESIADKLFAEFCYCGNLKKSSHRSG